MEFRKRLVLASRSPRRIALLRQLGLNAEVVPSDVPEDFDASLGLEENVSAIAFRKASEVAKQFDHAVVLGADTIVVIGGRVLGKPAGDREAEEMLGLLSGKTHTVYTGIALIDRPSGTTLQEVVATQVTFREIPPEEIRSYVAGGSPLDKAGAYGIQDDYGAVFVESIAGCFYNVVGLPVSRFYMMLQQLNTVS
jgi:nucleoside triphosphate pyrophosphatase